MRFLVDAQLPPALARWIVAKGHDAQHVADIEMAGSSDHNIWATAMEMGAVIVSKDEDFTRMSRSETGPAIVWITSGNTSKKELLQKMENVFPTILAALNAGERIVEVR